MINIYICYKQGTLMKIGTNILHLSNNIDKLRLNKHNNKNSTITQQQLDNIPT